jgi:hypothetical protein
MYAPRLIRSFKPGVIQAEKWKLLAGQESDTLCGISKELGKCIAVAKPSLNLYLSSTLIGSIINLAGHGEMAVSRIFSPYPCSQQDERLINLLPIQVELTHVSSIDSSHGVAKVGSKMGKFLNHFGYRKIVMNIQPETLMDHAWIACALSYSILKPPRECKFDPQGGWIAGGIAGITKDGCVFRGSAVDDADGTVVTANESFTESLSANGRTQEEVIDIVTCNSSQFIEHKYYKMLERSD